MTLVIADIESERGLLFDGESYLSEVGDADLDRTVGGITPGAAVVTALVIFGAGIGIGAAVYYFTH
jgi:hypothetical protein